MTRWHSGMPARTVSSMSIFSWSMSMTWIGLRVQNPSSRCSLTVWRVRPSVSALSSTIICCWLMPVMQAMICLAYPCWQSRKTVVLTTISRVPNSQKSWSRFSKIAIRPIPCFPLSIRILTTRAWFLRSIWKLVHSCQVITSYLVLRWPRTWFAVRSFRLSRHKQPCWQQVLPTVTRVVSPLKQLPKFVLLYWRT